MTATTNDHHEEHHVMPLKIYFGVFGALLVLSFLTVFVSKGIHLGAASLPVAMIVATAKASLVVLYFMHVLHDNRLIGLIVVACIFFMMLFFSMTMLDTANRDIVTYLENNYTYRDQAGAALVVDVEAHHGDEHHGEEHGAAHGEEHGEEHGDEGAALAEPAGEAHGDDAPAADDNVNEGETAPEPAGEQAAAVEAVGDGEDSADEDAAAAEGDEATEEEAAE